MPLNLNIPQNEFYHMNKSFRAFVAGYRGGKTFLGCVRLCTLALEYPDIRLGYFAPTYPQIRDIFYSTIGEVAELLGMTVDIKTSNNEVSLYFHGDLHAVIKCRSMEHPARIVGFDINHALIDEIDCMKKAKADAAWKKIVARLSSSGFDERRLYDEEMCHDLIIEALEENTVDFTTTPEGFNWIYDFFVKQLRDNPELQEFYGIINASSRLNAKNLPPDYIRKLEATYPANLVDAYVDGEFVNLSSGTVYRQFDRRLNSSEEVENGSETLHIGMDFNVGKMSAIVHVERDKLPVAVNEIFGCLDTPDMVQQIQMLYPDRNVCVYPDSSGKNRKSSDASETDINCLEEAGFNVYYESVNPRVRDRINAMNAMFCNGANERRYKVNTNLCPRYTDDLEQQVYNKQGDPDKSHDHDHMCFTGDTMVMTSIGNKRIDQLDESGVVYGADGIARKYTNCKLTGSNKVTVSVVFSDGSVVQCTPEHKFLLEDGTWLQAKELKGKKCLILAKQSKSFAVKDIICAGIISQFKGITREVKDCIGLFGNCISVKYQAGITFTTKITTGLTIKSKTLNYLKQVSTLGITQERRKQGNSQENLVRNISTEQKSGTGLLQEYSGIKNSTKKQKTSSIKKLQRGAVNAISNLKGKVALDCHFVQTSVNQPTEENPELMTSRESVSSAVKNLRQTNILKTLDVLSVDTSSRSNVYCLTVDDHGCFALAGGHIVSNCDAGGYYIAYAYPIAKAFFAPPVNKW